MAFSNNSYDEQNLPLEDLVLEIEAETEDDTAMLVETSPSNEIYPEDKNLSTTSESATKVVRDAIRKIFHPTNQVRNQPDSLNHPEPPESVPADDASSQLKPENIRILLGIRKLLRKKVWRVNSSDLDYLLWSKLVTPYLSQLHPHPHRLLTVSQYEQILPELLTIAQNGSEKDQIGVLMECCDSIFSTSAHKNVLWLVEAVLDQLRIAFVQDREKETTLHLAVSILSRTRDLEMLNHKYDLRTVFSIPISNYSWNCCWDQGVSVINKLCMCLIKIMAFTALAMTILWYLEK